MMDQDHILIQSIFEIYHTTKDKGDFIENIKLVYKWKYKQNLRELIKPMSDSLQMSQAEVLFNNKSIYFLIKINCFNKKFHFVMDCIEEDMPNIMGPYELYMSLEQTPEAEQDFKDTLNIFVRVYKKEIYIFEKSFYMAGFA